MNSSDKTTVGKLHIIIVVVILIEVIILLVVFTVFILRKNSPKETTIVSENSNENTTTEDSSIDAVTDAHVNSESTETILPSTFTYTIDGLSFEIPDTYKTSGNSFQSDYSKLYFVSQKIEGFWALYMLASDKDIDGYADSAVSSYMAGAIRESTADSFVAGCKSRHYKYTGNINGEKYILSAEIIVSPSNDGAIGIIFLTPERNSELKDYDSIIKSGTKSSQ